MNGDVCVAAETAQQLRKVDCFHCIVHKDDALWADEVDQKNADAMSTDDDDNLDDDAVYTMWTATCSQILMSWL